MFKMSKNVRSVLEKYLSRDRNFLRIKNVTRSRNCNHYIISTKDVLTIMDRTRQEQEHRNVEFETFFENLINGHQLLYARNVTNYRRLLENPFQEKGFAAICIDLQPDGTITTTAAAAAARKFGSQKDKVNSEPNFPSSVPMQQDESDVYAAGPSRPIEHETNTAYPNPPSCASMYSEMHPSPYPDTLDSMENIEINQKLIFVLPTFIQILKETFSRKNSSKFPGMRYIPTKLDDESESAAESNHQQSETRINQGRPTTPPPPERSVSHHSFRFSVSPPPAPPPSPVEASSSPEPEETVEPATAEENGDTLQEHDPFQMDIDESKHFMYTDPMFKNEYKFHAIKINWNTGLRSFVINPFFENENEGTYLYFPVKKH